MTDKEIKRELSLHLKDEGYIPLLQGLRKAVTPILSNNILPHFTDHSVSHSDRLVEIINKLLSPIPESKKLSNQELLILFASCYLHDIGMQYENAGQTITIEELNLRQEWLELAESTRRDYLRDYHHKISAEFVMMLGPNHVSPISYNLPPDMKPEYIAALCEAHGVSVEDSRYKELIDSVPDIRMPLLSALLRAADILDESCNRMSIEKLNTLLLDIESKKHWWRHYYTEAISFDAKKMQITVHFDFPQKKRAEYENIVPHLQLPLIKSEFSNHNAVFNEFQLNWSITYDVLPKIYTSVKCLPDEVLAEMLKELHFRKSKEAEEKQLMVLNSFAEAKPYIQRRIDGLKAKKEELDSNKYLLELWDIAKYMKGIGSIRSSWKILWSDFSKDMQSLSIERQIEVGTWLAETMLEDGLVRDAVDVINRISGLANELEDIDRLTNFLKTKLKAMVFGFHWDEAKETFISLYLKTSDPVEKQKISADMSEWYFLNGESIDISDLLRNKEDSQC